MLLAVGLSASGIIPFDCPSYSEVWKFLMPLAAACFMLDMDMGRWAMSFEFVHGGKLSCLNIQAHALILQINT